MGKNKKFLANLHVQPLLIRKIKENQMKDPELEKTKGKMKERPDFSLLVDGTLFFKGRICVPSLKDLKEEIMKEAHCAKYVIHPGSTKMYQNLKEVYWGNNMKREIAEYVKACLTCQRIKAEHQRPAGELQPLEIPQWKWENISMDFSIGLLRTQVGHDAIWVIVDILTKSAHFLAFKTTSSMDKMVQHYSYIWKELWRCT